MKFKNTNCNPIEEIHEFGLDRTHREIYLFGRDEHIHGAGSEDEGAVGDPGIEYASANQFLRNFRILQLEEHDGPITIHLKSCGGFWEQGIAIYDMIRSHPGEVTCINWAEARSMTSLIFLACDVRLMTKHSWFMFHEGDVAFAGTQRQMRSAFAQTELEQEQMRAIYFDRLREGAAMTADSDEAIVRWIKSQMMQKEEVYLSPADAIAYGFATGMYGEE